MKHGVISIITQNHVVQALADDKEVFKSIRGTTVSRSFPSQGRLAVEAKNILSKILEDGFILFDESDYGIRLCYESGWIHRDFISKSIDQWYFIGVLPSRLHEK